MYDILEQLRGQGVIEPLDLEFARFMATLANDDQRGLLLASALVSRAVANGDVCLDLNRHAAQRLLPPADGQEAIILPALARWRDGLLKSAVVGEPGEFQPLVLDADNRLYLYRYWDYETQLVADLIARARRSWPLREERLQQGLERLFPASERFDWQKVAAAVAVLRGFCVISGGPGTGKTTTLARILALLIEQSETPLRIRLAAPTGKAAARMQEAVQASKAALAVQVAPAVLEAIPEEASTLHRLLSLKPDGVYFRHDRDNPLGLDVLVIDEASMVDLALMVKTVWGLPPTARLILLGDKDQLSSVEAGAVLGELCAGTDDYSPAFAAKLSDLTGQPMVPWTEGSHPLQDNVALLNYSYRFGADSGIGRLADLVNRADIGGLAALAGTVSGDFQWDTTPHEKPVEAMLQRMTRGYEAYLKSARQLPPGPAILAAFNRFQVLCPTRKGDLGVENLNQRFESLLKAQARYAQRTWYPGRPVMITRNDYQLHLFNGDIGIALPDPEDPEQIRVYFQDSNAGLRSVAVSRLPSHEPVFAMTVHKSQGSEFERVLLVLSEEDSPVMTRELIYTGITRARTVLELWGSRESLFRAVQRTVRRASGLGAGLLACGEG